MATELNQLTSALPRNYVNTATAEPKPAGKPQPGIIQRLKNTNINWWILGSLAVLSLVWVFLVDWFDFGDDSGFRSVLYARPYLTMWDWMRERYESWSSRGPIEVASLIMVWHPLAWRLLTALAAWIIMAVPPLLITTNPKIRTYLLAFSAIVTMSLPNMVWFEAGLVANTVNYSWVQATGILAAIPAIKIIQKKDFLYWVPLAAIAGLYAASSELMASLLMALYLLTFAKRFTTGSLEKREWALLGAAGIALLGMVFFHLMSPGNASRTHIETGYHFPGFVDTTIAQRAEFGVTQTLRVIFSNRYIPTLAFFGALFVAAIRHPRAKWLAPLSAVPLIAVLWISDNSMAIIQGLNYGSAFARINEQFTKGVGLNIFGPGGPSVTSLAAFLVLMALTVATALATILVLVNAPKVFAVYSILVVGFGSRAILGFAPTIWITGARGEVHLLFAFAVAAMIIIKSEMERASAAAILSSQPLPPTALNPTNAMEKEQPTPLP